MTRKSFIILYVFLFNLVCSQDKLDVEKKHENHNTPHAMDSLKGAKRLNYSWANPNIKPSPQPSLTGKQMGVVNTLGIKPLGYEMDGNVKVFRLFAQPIEQYITDGQEAEYEKLIPDKNKVSHGIMHHHKIVQKIHAWGFNGTTPGPTIEVNEGDRIRLVTGLTHSLSKI